MTRAQRGEPEQLSEQARLAHRLLTAQAVRRRCGQVLEMAELDELDHFALRRERLAACAAYVVETIRANYPRLDIPIHARWRHFEVAGQDRWQRLADTLRVTPEERARIRLDLAVTSVLLDAGAGPAWRFHDPASGMALGRSEGLGVASFEAFRAGLFSADPAEPLRADAEALAAITPADLARAFQAGPDNPLVGLEGRADLLRRLGQALQAQPLLFGAPARIGNLFDGLVERAPGGVLPAAELLALLLRALGPIWPGRIELGGVNLGDTWRHPAVGGDGLVPFHKLTQWLAYSLIEPLEEAGLKVGAPDALTALAEYRNGGLLIDSGVLEPRDPAILGRAFAPEDEIIVEWRALTVPLIDELARFVRMRLGLEPEALPLGKVLEGGTWSAGRRLAGERRPDAAPPLAIASDGSVF